MTKYKRSVLITDLDDTLWNWLSIWHAWFRPALEEIIKILGVTEDEIIPVIKKIHEAVGTSEYNYLVYDLEKELTGNTNIEEIRKKYKSVFKAQNYARKHTMVPFPDIIESLRMIKSQGTKIIGYTESMAFASMDRIKLFKLDGMLEVLYSREDYEVPDGLNLDRYRSKSYDEYQLLYTKHETLPKGAMKPDPQTLMSIIQGVGADLEDCIYVGDKLHKDVKMAQETGVLDVYAEYGDKKNSDEYEFLKLVTHWKDKAVKEEAKRNIANTPPTIKLENKFSDIFSFVEFQNFN